MPRRTRIENPEAIGDVTEPPFVRLPNPATLFAARAERLRAIAADHVLSDYLRFLGAIVDAQHAAAQALPPPPPLAPGDLDMRVGAAMPPLAPDVVFAGTAFADTLTWLLRALPLEDGPEAARQAREALLRLSAQDLARLAECVLVSAYPPDRLGECLFVAAALQVHLAALAAQLPAERLRPVGDGACPSCGGAPVASLIVGWPGASRARYLCCALCSTMWNYVRIKCTSCGSTEAIEYLGIEQGPPEIAAEACGKCRCYTKHLKQQDNPALEPLADDIASFALDRLVQEEGFRRSGVNPFLVSA